ncbi:Dehydrodolichyl diphosphate synthase subunit [Carabus blaptoides fortunei]
MQLAKEKFEKLLEEKDRLMSDGICIRVIGNLSLLTDDLRRLIAKAMIMTQNNNKAFLNIAFAYTSRDEITNSIKSIIEGVEAGMIEEKDISEQLISNCLYTNKSPDPDLLYVLLKYECDKNLTHCLQGFERLCIEMGIPEMTVYAFSVYNFKRNMDETFAAFSTLINLCDSIIQNESFEMKHGVRVRFIGDMSLVSDHLKINFAKTQLKTQHNNMLTVNIAVAYASRYEITNSVKCIVDGVKEQMITVDDIDEQLISDCLYTSGSSDVDVLVRSSGEARLNTNYIIKYFSISTGILHNYIKMFKLPACISLWARRLCINILKSGPIPKHIGFIMDGHRRYSVKHNMVLYDSYQLGCYGLQDFEQLCIEMGIPEITVYAFSVYNFKRNMDEIFAVFSMLTNFCDSIVQDYKNESFEMKYGVRVRFIGDMSLLPDHLKINCAKTQLKTQHNNMLTVNIAVAYASRYEITNSVKCIVDGVEEQMITVEDIDEQLISDCLYTSGSSDVDVLVRSSGETRLSDFLIWQSCTASLEFINKLWPDLSMWDFFAIILRYQRQYEHILSVRDEMARLQPICLKSNNRVENFVESVKEFRQKNMESWA